MRTLLATGLSPGLIDIADEEAHHALHVLRLHVGDRVRLADGAGMAALGEITTTDRHRLSVRIDSCENLPPDRLAVLTVAVAPPKGDRWGDLVRGLTELGVGTILPLVCERGERIPGNAERTRRVAAEALKQCRRGWMPHIGPPTGIPGLAACGQRVILGDRAGSCPQPGAPRPTVLVIGPEGGLTEDERQSLLAAGAEAVRLAGTILRIETAALAAAAVWATAWEHAAP